MRGTRTVKRARAAEAGNAIIGQSGGPTAVINQSLAGLVESLRKHKHIRKVYGMRHGVNGLVKDDVIDLTKLPLTHLNKIAVTPSAALGSSRDKPDRDYCNAILNACTKFRIRYFFYIGGNDSSDTCRIVNELAREAGYEMTCYHVPKTVDNDLMMNDHTPGFPSAARFQALAFMADSLDNASLPGVKINIVMGRHAGFLTAAAALARGEGKGADRNGPHLVYLPEVPLNRDSFLTDVERVYARLGRCQVAVSEGITDARGQPMISQLMENLDRDSHGNIQLSGVGALGDALADLVRRNVKLPSGKALRVRADTFGYLQRCWPDPSPIDSREARDAAKFAVSCAMRGEPSGSIAIVRLKNKPYKAGYKRVELTDVAAKTRHMPKEFIEGSNNVTRAFLNYAKPLVGPLPVMTRL
ncbi:MAG: 6-phosphofructokinase [Phycisphaeraceae bacterium]|nr:6-phosphofructokinase [Phycisphaeraceae bacterium]